MLTSPLFAKYYIQRKAESNNNTTSIERERTWFLFGVNVGLTYSFSLFTYMLSFAGVLSYDINTMIYSNNSFHLMKCIGFMMKQVIWLDQLQLT